MSLAESDAYTRLRDAARKISAALIVDRPSIRWIDSPYAGVSYGLSLGPALGSAHALLFMPAADIAEPGWEARLSPRLEAAHRYLQGFTQSAR
jgi:hypothetical protein